MAVLGLRDDLDVVFLLKELGQSVTHDRVVVGDDDSNAHFCKLLMRTAIFQRRPQYDFRSIFVVGLNIHATTHVCQPFADTEESEPGGPMG
jgi:hypothetical protein